MGGSCPEGEYWDALVKRCLPCHMVCQQEQSQITKCTSYCVSAHCKALPGHYYDALLKKCVKCAKICGRHPAECSQHCQSLSSHKWMTKLPITAPSPPVTTKKLLVTVTSRIPNSRGLVVSTALEDSTVLFYSLMALCMVLLLSSLSLALAVFLRGTKAKTSKQGPKMANHTQECVVQPGPEVGLLSGQPERRSKDSVTNSSRSTDREPLEDSSPTETCVCVHCFPDLTALGQGNDRPVRAPFSFNQQAVLQQAQIQKGGPLSSPEESLHTSGPEVQEEAAVG